MAAADPMFKALQRLQSLMTSFDEPLSQLCKDNSSESALDLRKNLMEYYHDLHKALQSWYETLTIKEEKPEESATLGNNKENKTSNVQVDYRLKTICDNVDGRGLVRYIVLNMKDEKTLRKDLSVAFSNASNPAKLALTALQGYHFYKVGIRRACVLILEYLFPIFGNDDSAAVPLHVKNSAREIAKFWRNRMNRKSALDSQAFLQLLISFRIAADYEKDELLEILFTASRHKQATELCRSLGLSPDADFLDKFSKNLGPLDVLRFAHVFGMMEKVDPVGLLTSFLRDVEKDITEMRAHNPDASQIFWTNADIKKMGALKNVIYHVEIYGLQCDSFKDNLQNELRELEVERKRRKVARRLERTTKAAMETKKQNEYEEKAPEKKAQEKEDREKAGEKAQEKEDGEKAGEKKELGKEDREKAAEKKSQEKEDREKATEKEAQEKEGGKKAAEKKAQEKADREKATEKEAQEKEDGKKAAEKKAQEKRDGKKAAEKKAQEKDGKIATAQEKKDGEKAAEKNAQEKKDRQKAAEKKARAKEDGQKAAAKKAEAKEDTQKATEKKAQVKGDGMKAAEKKVREKEGIRNATEKRSQEKEDGKKAAEHKAPEKEDGKKAAEHKAPEKEDGNKAAEQKAQEKEDRKEDSEKKAQYKRRQSFETGYGISERENYASKRAKHASPNETTRVGGGRDNSKASPYNIYRVQNKSGIICHDHHPSAFSAANRSSTGVAAGAFTSTPSMAAQINDVRRRDEGYPSALGTSNLTPMGSSLYSSGVPAGAFSVPLSNVAKVNYEGRGEQSYMSNLGEVDKNHVRALVYGTGDLAKSSATESNYNFEGRGQLSYKLNFGEIGNNPVRASAYATGVVANSSATQCHHERRGPELYTSTLGGGLTGSIGSSVYGSNPRTIPSSNVNQGSFESGLVSSGFGSSVSSVPPSSATEGHSETRGSVIDRYRFKIG